MKKQILCLAVIAMVFASCSKNEIIDAGSSNNAAIISIDPSTGKSRATENDLPQLKTTTGFGVFATKDGDTKTTHIDNVKYKWSTDKWIWDGATPQWPTTLAEYPMYFYGYYPSTIGNLANDAMTKEITVATLAADQIDYLSATSGEIVTRPASGSVALNFKHIMSKINFNFTVGKEFTVAIQKVAIQNVGQVGTFNFGTQSWDAKPTAFASGYVYRSYETTARPTADIIAGTDGFAKASLTKTDGAPLMLMPQEATAWDGTIPSADYNGAVGPTSGAYIEMLFRMYDKTGGTDRLGKTGTTVDGNRYIKVGFPLNLAAAGGTPWAQAKSYTYTIYLGTPDATNGTILDEFYYKEDGTRTNEKITEGTPGKPTTPGDINFEVDVTGWGNEIEGDIK